MLLPITAKTTTSWISFHPIGQIYHIAGTLEGSLRRPFFIEETAMGAFNGTGTYVRTYNWVTDKGNAVAVTASRMDTEDDGFATGLSTCIAKDGQTTATARIPFTLGISLG